MNSNEMISIITHGDWRNNETNEVCSFTWSDSDQSINIEIKAGDRSGHRDSHKFVKLYHSKAELENCTILKFQSNLFKTEFRLPTENGPLSVDSDVFGKMELVRS